MPRPRFEKVPPEVRDAVLDAAAKEFAAHGYEAASVNRILAAADLSKGSFYYYFDDKADLAAAVLEREAKKLLASWESLKSPATAGEFWSELSRLMQLGSEQMRSAPHTSDALSRLGTAVAKNPQLLERMTSSLVPEMMGRIAEFWRRGQEVGAVRADLPVATLMAVIQDMKLSLTHRLLPADRAPTHDEFEHFLEVHFDLVRRVSEARR